MPTDVETMRQWTLVALTIASIPVTTFPLLYLLFSPWYKSQLGRAVLLKSLSVACLLDFSVVYRYWAFTDNIRTLLVIWFYLIIFVGAAASYQLGVLIFANFIRPWKARKKDVEQSSEHPSEGPLPE